MSIRSVEVSLAGRSYSIQIGHGLAAQNIEPFVSGRKVALLTDETVAGQSWFPGLLEAIRNSSTQCTLLKVPAGESSKNLSVLATLCSQLATAGLNRHSMLVVVGGGVVGDLGGFLAASYLRGIEFVQVPTTLLAAVDSSVGGKTGVNLPEGKNLVGAFYQPRRVVIDLEFLETLPAREFAAGMAEVVKYGMIRDENLFANLERGRPDDLAGLIETCVRIKAEVVAGDEKEENGLRAILNFGHTIGHAIEQSAGYGRLLHGEAVAIGMMGAAWISQQKAGLGAADVQRLRGVLQKQDLPVHFPGLKYENLAAALARDKKSTAQGVRWILTPRIGSTVARTDVPEALVRGAVEFCSGALQ